MSRYNGAPVLHASGVQPLVEARAARTIGGRIYGTCVSSTRCASSRCRARSRLRRTPCSASSCPRRGPASASSRRTRRRYCLCTGSFPKMARCAAEGSATRSALRCRFRHQCAPLHYQGYRLRRRIHRPEHLHTHSWRHPVSNTSATLRKMLRIRTATLTSHTSLLTHMPLCRLQPTVLLSRFREKMESRSPSQGCSIRACEPRCRYSLPSPPLAEGMLFARSCLIFANIYWLIVI